MTNTNGSIIPYLEQFNTSCMLEKRIILMLQDPNIAEIEVSSVSLIGGRIINSEGQRLVRKERVEGWTLSYEEQEEFENRYLQVLYPNGSKLSFTDVDFWYNAKYLVIKKKQ